MLFETLEQGVRGVDGLKIGTAILTGVCLLDLSAKCMRDELCTVADAKDGQSAYELREIDLESLRVVYRMMTPMTLGSSFGNLL